MEIHLLKVFREILNLVLIIGNLLCKIIDLSTHLSFVILQQAIVFLRHLFEVDKAVMLKLLHAYLKLCHPIVVHVDLVSQVLLHGVVLLLHRVEVRPHDALALVHCDDGFDGLVEAGELRDHVPYLLRLLCLTNFQPFE